MWGLQNTTNYINWGSRKKVMTTLVVEEWCKGKNVGIPRVDVYILCTQNESGSMFELCTLLSNIQRGCCVEFCSRNVCTLEAIVRYDNNGN